MNIYYAFSGHLALLGGYGITRYLCGHIQVRVRTKGREKLVGKASIIFKLV